MGISTMVVLQSLAQARAVWGEHAASAVWDAAIVKIVLGGGSTARDLDDLSHLIGQREETQTSSNTSADGRRSVSTSHAGRDHGAARSQHSHLLRVGSLQYRWSLTPQATRLGSGTAGIKVNAR